MTNAEILLKAYRGNELLRERIKSIAKEHTERRKKLSGLMQAVNKAETTRGCGQAEMETATISLSPDLSDLLENPAHGL